MLRCGARRGESNGDCGAGEAVVGGVGRGLRGDADGEIILDFHYLRLQVATTATAGGSDY